MHTAARDTAVRVTDLVTHYPGRPDNAVDGISSPLDRQNATRAGIAQSVVSAYENGRRRPSVETLERLVTATGHDLVLDLAPARPTGDHPLAHRVAECRDRMVAVAAARGGSNLRLFGGAARGDETPDSDVDLLVDLAPGTGLFALIGMERELSELLAVDVDLVPAGSLEARIRNEVMADAVPL